MTQNEIVELMRLLDESDITTWPLVLRNASKDDKATFLFKVRKG